MKKNLPDCCSNACEKPALTKKIAVAEKIMAEQNKVLAKAYVALMSAKTLYGQVNAGGFSNGVTDATGMIDEGEIIAGRLMDEIDEAITAIIRDKDTDT
jgi:hypothetical protein